MYISRCLLLDPFKHLPNVVMIMMMLICDNDDDDSDCGDDGGLTDDR